MQIDVGDKGFAIWLLGDSNPGNWQDVLVTPLDPRHPARHNIWTPVLDVIQDSVFRKHRSRVDTSAIYIRNAIEDPTNRPPDNTLSWNAGLEQKVEGLRQLIYQYRPILLLCFGAFSFEFARRALMQKPEQPFGYWGAKTLGEEFRQRIDNFDSKAINALPLLHTSISRGRFIESHNYFCEQEGGNYFEFAGNRIADKLLQYRGELRIWID